MQIYDKEISTCKFHDITSAQGWGYMHWCEGVETADKNWQFNKTDNSTKTGNSTKPGNSVTLAIQQKVEIQQN